MGDVTQACGNFRLVQGISLVAPLLAIHEPGFVCDPTWLVSIPNITRKVAFEER
jgi:hypothetical protein